MVYWLSFPPLMMTPDPSQAISLMLQVWLHQTRIGLSLYDVTGQGFLRESDLENYILELIGK